MVAKGEDPGRFNIKLAARPGWPEQLVIRVREQAVPGAVGMSTGVTYPTANRRAGQQARGGDALRADCARPRRGRSGGWRWGIGVPPRTGGRLGPPELAGYLESAEPPLVLGVRNPGEFQTKRIDGAVIIPLNRLRPRLG